MSSCLSVLVGDGEKGEVCAWVGAGERSGCVVEDAWCSRLLPVALGEGRGVGMVGLSVILACGACALSSVCVWCGHRQHRYVTLCLQELPAESPPRRCITAMPSAGSSSSSPTSIHPLDVRSVQVDRPSCHTASLHSQRCGGLQDERRSAAYLCLCVRHAMAALSQSACALSTWYSKSTSCACWSRASRSPTSDSVEDATDTDEAGTALQRSLACSST